MDASILDLGLHHNGTERDGLAHPVLKRIENAATPPLVAPESHVEEKGDLPGLHSEAPVELFLFKGVHELFYAREKDTLLNHLADRHTLSLHLQILVDGLLTAVFELFPLFNLLQFQLPRIVFHPLLIQKLTLLFLVALEYVDHCAVVADVSVIRGVGLVRVDVAGYALFRAISPFDPQVRLLELKLLHRGVRELEGAMHRRPGLLDFLLEPDSAGLVLFHHFVEGVHAFDDVGFAHTPMILRQVLQLILNIGVAAQTGLLQHGSPRKHLPHISLILQALRGPFLRKRGADQASAPDVEVVVGLSGHLGGDLGSGVGGRGLDRYELDAVYLLGDQIVGLESGSIFSRSRIWK